MGEPDDLPNELIDAMNALSDRKRLTLLLNLMEHGEMSFLQISQRVKFNPQSVMHHMNVLVRAGLAESFYIDVNHSIYQISPLGEELLNNVFRALELASESEEKPRKGEKKIAVFLSASFADSAKNAVDWFRKMADSVGMEIVWLKETYESRPAREKILSYIDNCDAFMQIITSDIATDNKEAGWLGNEVAWAYRSKPGNCIAVFVEKGSKCSGLAHEVADNLSFDRDNLQLVAPTVIRYLLDLKLRTQLKLRNVNVTK